MKKIIFIGVVILFLVIINNLVHSILDLWQKKDYVMQAEKELSRQKQKNQELMSKLSYAKTQEFVEKEARDKLFMVKTGEQRVLVPSDSGETKQENQKTNLPNWQQWWNLFF